MPYVLRCFPHDDDVFAARARAGLDRLDGAATAVLGDGLPERLAELLRGDYPAVTVHRSHELANVIPDVKSLYVYRDGRALGATASG